MKLHNLCSKDPKRIALNYILIKDDFVYVTDASVFAKIPIEMVFEEGLFSSKENYCIAASEWKASKIWEAKSVSRDGKKIEVVSKKGVPYIFFLEETSDINYPDINRFANKDYNAIDSISLDASLLALLQESLGLKSVTMSFRTKSSCINITSPANPGLVAGIMPTTC